MGVQDVVKHYNEMLPYSRQEEIGFEENRPSLAWVDSFTMRHNFAYKAVKVIDDKRVQAVTEQHIAAHIARVKAAMVRYSIKDARFIFNMDQSGASFAKMTGRSPRKGVGPRDAVLINSGVRTRGKLERVTIVLVVSAADTAFKRVIMFPGKKAHFRRTNGNLQALHTFLLQCYLYQREVPGVDTAIIYDWAKKFVTETTDLRRNGQYLLLIIDGYGSHVQFKTLKLFRDNHIIVVALPAHASHVQQPLGISVFYSYKSLLQREVHAFAQRKKVLDAFDISVCITKCIYRISHCSQYHKGV